MRFLIADTFTSSLGRLTNEEQSLVKNSAFDMQLNPSHPGLQFHRITGAKDKNFWSVRVGRDIRIIVHKTDADFLLCYVNHHNDAYTWAERRRLQTHPETGAAQLIEIREKVQEFVVPKYVEAAAPKETPALLFNSTSDSVLLGYGVPVEWLSQVRLATEDSLLELVEHLPSEAAEALLELATGGRPQAAAISTSAQDPFEHPDAQRRFRLISSNAELSQALEYPWDKWAIFLHPQQRALVDRDFSGPARVSGSAGTGKTIVALHRAFVLAKNHPDSRVLLTTFSDSLAWALSSKLKRLIAKQPLLGEQIEVLSLPLIIKRLYEQHFGQAKFASDDEIRALINSERDNAQAAKFTGHFLWKEWQQIIDAWQIRRWEDYRDVARLGRKTRLNEEGRKTLWSLFESVRARQKAAGIITQSDACERLREYFHRTHNSPFDFAVVDEAQDITVPQLRLLGALLGDRPNGLFFAGDQGQRIFQQPFSWTFLGVDIRGRSSVLKVNYRTSHEIRLQADRLLDPQFTDVDGVTDDRRGTISVFSGPVPQIRTYHSIDAENLAVGEWLQSQLQNGVADDELCVIVRSEAEIPRALDAIRLAGRESCRIDEQRLGLHRGISLATMHSAKGLEYRCVAVIACDDEIVPLQSRIESVGDDADLQEVYATERQLLYVACTRARDSLWVSGVEPVSEFLDDLKSA